MPDHHFSRRRLLGLLTATIASVSLQWSSAHAAKKQASMHKVSSSSDSNKPTVGIALGAGGANGLAHILMLEALDEMGIKPHRIAGSSIGAIIGALYASGISGKQIRELVERFIISPEEGLVEEVVEQDAARWVEFLDIELGEGGLLSEEGFISFLYDTIEQETFEQLDIPLKIIAADLWHRNQIVLQSGALLPAIKASMALPGVFDPVILENRVLIDGGTVNPVPYDQLSAECDIVIGIDVSGERSIPEAMTPGYFATIFNAAKVMQQAIMTEKLRHEKPEIYLSPRIVDIRALEFYRASEVFEQARPAKQELKQQLSKLLGV
ncbi:MAG: patatin-like phospholipase family protein [Pseudomonadaceae bacterium]|nr:patatin-like phospholipase family protein [Pseudomonadaceae bacterium]